MTKYITKDSGERIDLGTGYVRDTNADKPAFHLMFPKGIPYEEQPLTRVADILRRGEQKYGTRNWELAEKPEEYERFKESALRHLIQVLNDEDDEDHAAAVVFNMLGIMMMQYKLDVFEEDFNNE